jgi:putative ABC transport system permease protein
MLVDRLTSAAVLGGLRQRAWSLLIVAAFGVLAAAGAAGQMFAEASDNAAFQVRLGELATTSRQNDAAVVRMSANVGPKSFDQQSVIADMRAVPGLTEPDLAGASIGAELAAPTFWGFTVDGRERGRLFAVGSPAAELVPVGAAGPDGIWLPRPMATELGVHAGDQVVLALKFGNRGTPRKVTTTVGGVYAVDAAGRLPAEVNGGHKWALRRGDTPEDTEYRTLPAYLLIGDVPTVERLAQATGDQIFWSVEAALAPGATLAEAKRTAAGLEEVRRKYATNLPTDGNELLSLRFASGIGRIVDNARATTETVRQRTRPVEWAATGVGLASVLAVALLTARRRDREIRHEVATGMGSLRVGGLWLLEHLLPAVLGAGLGGLAAWQLVVRLGPPGTLAESLAPAAWTAALVALAGLVTVGCVGTLAAMRRVRPSPPATARRSLPWSAMVVVVALVAAASLVGAGGTANGVDLLVPLLVLAAAGVIAGWLPGRLAGGSRPRSAVRPGRRAGQPGLPSAPGRAVVWLARRRLGSGGAERRLAVTVVTAGLGMLLFGLSAVDSTAVSSDDRVAVAAGAESIAVLAGGSAELDPGAVTAPANDPLRGAPPDAPVAGARVPPLPAGNTVVWRSDVLTPLDDFRKDLLVIDPARFLDVALWGHGPDLAAARAAVAALAADPGTADESNGSGSAHAIVVGDPASALVDTIRVTAGVSTEDIEVAARVPAFPGMRGRPMYVVAATPMFAKLGPDDPRPKPRNELPAGAQLFRATLWSSTSVEPVLTAAGVQPESVGSATLLRQDATYIATERARGYQLAIAGYLALLAVLTLCVYAQRTAVLRRPTDLMLARVGLGRSRVRRAQALEFVLLAVVAFAAAVAGVAALAPIGGRLLDEQPGLLPRYAFQLSPLGLAITAGAAVVAAALAVALTTVRSASAEEDAYRDD